jgi:hypothetical protein
MIMRAGVGVCAWSLTACVQWRPVAAPPAPAPAASRAAVLPRWVRVTTRDSARYLLEDAEFQSDTLVGQGNSDRATPLVRVPAADIAHLEARLPSLSGSVGVAAAILAGLGGFLWLIGHTVALETTWETQ